MIASGELGDGDRVAGLDQLSGGWSRHSFVAHARLAAGGERRYVVRVKPPGGLLDTDLEVEYRVFASLHDSSVAAPRVFALEPAGDTGFAGPFFVMEHVEGTAANIFQARDRDALAEDFHGPRQVAEDMVANLVRIHSSTAPVEGLPEFAFGDLVDRWRAVYDARQLARDPVVEEAFDWLDEHAPRDVWPGLVHGDYRIGNTLVADGRVTAILDWELAHRGDVRLDLGYLALRRQAGKHLRTASPLMGTFADEAWFLERYSQLSGREVARASLRPFEVLGITMLLATQYTAVWMYAHGETSDMRMAWSRYSLPGLRQDLTELMAW